MKVDTSAINNLGQEINRAKTELLERLARRGHEILREEAPVATGNLRENIAEPKIDKNKFAATLTLSAGSARAAGKAGTAILHLKSGKQRRVSLRGAPAFDYAEAIVRGRPAIQPRSAKALLIPVASVPSGESYLAAGGQKYLMRLSAKAVAPNPFHERAAKRIENEAEKIGDKILRKEFN